MIFLSIDSVKVYGDALHCWAFIGGLIFGRKMCCEQHPAITHFEEVQYVIPSLYSSVITLAYFTYTTQQHPALIQPRTGLLGRCLKYDFKYLVRVICKRRQMHSRHQALPCASIIVTPAGRTATLIMNTRQ